MKSKAIFAVVMVVVLLVSSPALALRVVVLVDTVVDGKKTMTSAFATQLENQLQAIERVTVIDSVQAARLRADGGIPTDLEIITSLDAELLIKGQVELTGRETFESLFRYAGEANLRLVTADSADNVKAVYRSVDDAVPTVAEGQAIIEVVKALGDEVFKEIRPAILASQRGAKARVELIVQSPEAMEHNFSVRLCSVARLLPGVSECQILHREPELVKAQLMGDGIDTQSVASGLEAIDGLGLVLTGQTHRTLRAEFLPGKVKRLPLWVRGIRGTKKVATLAKEATSIVAGSVLGLDFITEGDAAASKKEGLSLTGHMERREGIIFIEAQIRDGKNKVIAQSADTCIDAEALACFQKIGQNLSRNLSRLRAMVLQLPAGIDEPLVIGGLESPGIFGALAMAYSSGYHVGELEVEVHADTLDVEVSAQLEDGAPGHAIVSKLQRGNHRIPIFIDIPHEYWQNLSIRRTATLVVEVALLQRLQVVRRIQTQIVAYEINQIDWRLGRGVVAAVFVDSLAPAVLGWAQAAQKVAAGSSEELAVPATLFRSLDGLKYFRDANDPFQPHRIDYLRYPSETLVAGGGDCDDLAVLYASLLEAAGERAGLILLPGHIMVAVGTKKTSRHAHLYGGQDKVYLAEGELWIPVEATAIGVGFLDAWQRGLARLKQVSGERVQFISIAEARSRFPAAQWGRVPVGPPHFDEQRVSDDWQDLAKIRIKEVGFGNTKNVNLLGLNREGIKLARLGRLEEAIKVFVQARSRLAAAQSNLGNVYLLSGRYREAYLSQKEAIAVAPASLPIRINLVVAAFAAKSEDRYQFLKDIPADVMPRLKAGLRANSLAILDEKNLPQLFDSDRAESTLVAGPGLATLVEWVE